MTVHMEQYRETAGSLTYQENRTGSKNVLALTKAENKILCTPLFTLKEDIERHWNTKLTT